jgi:hypothetical protein
MSFTTVERHQSLKKSTIAIKPFFNPSTDNMGLQRYGLSLFDGAFHEEQLACLEMNGVKRYLTGLNEFAPEIKLIQDTEEREAKIKEIRKIVAELEKQLAANVISATDKDFWGKVKLCRPDNSELWDKILIRCGNEPVYLEPDNDPYDLIKVLAIENGGFSMIAKSYDDARSRAQAPKFYLDRQEDTAAIITEVKKLKNKAGAELQKLFDTHTKKMFLVAKIVDPNSMQYKKSTPLDVIYDNLDKYINGELIERDKRKAAKRFLDVCEYDPETLTIRALIKDATFLRLIYTKADGMIYHMGTSNVLGKNPSEVVEHLKNPLNEEMLKMIQSEVEKYWNL